MKKVTFLRLEAESKLVKNKGLLLCGNNVWFLNPILKAQIEVEEAAEDFEMKISFFTNSRFYQTISCRKVGVWDVISSKEYITRLDSQATVLGKIAIAVGVQESDIKQGDLLQKASRFIRDSDTLNEEQLKELPNEWRCIDGRGLALFGIQDDFVEQGTREIFLVMLGIAYYRALQQINQELAAMLLGEYDIEQLDELYKEAAEFNACYYFYNPIEFSRYPTFKAWQDIREAYHLQEKNQEVTSQLAQVHQILSYRQQKKENKINETRNRRLSFWGTVLAVLGLFEVIDVLKNWFGY